MSDFSKVIVGIVICIVITVFVLFDSTINKPIDTKDVYQYIDHDGRVVCYILENGNGISCLPMSEVNLSE